MIVQAATPADVRRAVLTARARGVRVAVRATGHGTFAEPAPATLLIDTSRMNSVLVDPDRRTARVGPGATWGDVIDAAAPFGLAPVSGTNGTVGVTGFTLGGGHGFLSRKHGLAADELISADVVTADGETLTAREDCRSGLFWALRGAGGNFGVATSLEFRLHPAREVFGGIAHFDPGLAPHLLARFREYAMPEALNVSVVVTPDAVALRGVYAGGADDAWRALAPLFFGEPFNDTFRAMPYSETGTIGGTAPRRFELLRDVPVDAILRTAETARAVEVKRWGGAIARANAPAGHRQVPFSVAVDGEDISPLAAHITGGSFLNSCPSATAAADLATRSTSARARTARSSTPSVKPAAPRARPCVRVTPFCTGERGADYTFPDPSPGNTSASQPAAADILSRRRQGGGEGTQAARRLDGWAVVRHRPVQRCGWASGPRVLDKRHLQLRRRATGHGQPDRRAAAHISIAGAITARRVVLRLGYHRTVTIRPPEPSPAALFPSGENPE